MKTALIFMFLALPSLSFSQMVNNVPLKDIDAEYVEFWAIGKAFDGQGRKVYLHLNYGQEWIRGDSRRTLFTMKDENGVEILFNSEIDCLNFMVKRGYELVSRIERISEGNSQSFFLMRKIKVEEKP
jgi:hypothetical protein